MGKSLYILQRLPPMMVIICMTTFYVNRRALNVLEMYIYYKPYLDTTTSKQVEYTKAFELTIIKELGKLTP